MNETEFPIVQKIARRSRTNISIMELERRARKLADEILNREVRIEVREVQNE